MVKITSPTFTLPAGQYTGRKSKIKNKTKRIAAALEELNRTGEYSDFAMSTHLMRTYDLSYDDVQKLMCSDYPEETGRCHYCGMAAKSRDYFGTLACPD